MRCVSCLLVFADVAPERYEATRHNAWDDEELTDDSADFYGAARGRPHDEFLRRHRPHGTGKLLDVGSGLGYFLERARDAGWAVHGCEPSSVWSARAADRLGASNVTHGLLSDVDEGLGPFDVITCWDVIEHIYDPVEVLREMRRRLAPGGSIFLRTPNIAYLLPAYRLRRALGHTVELGPMNHVVYFDVRSMGRALEAAGLRLASAQPLPPPQVPLSSGGVAQRADASAPSVRAKNGWYAASRLAARASRDRLVLSSDLDVVAVSDAPSSAAA